MTDAPLTVRQFSGALAAAGFDADPYGGHYAEGQMPDGRWLSVQKTWDLTNYGSDGYDTSPGALMDRVDVQVSEEIAGGPDDRGPIGILDDVAPGHALGVILAAARGDYSGIPHIEAGKNLGPRPRFDYARNMLLPPLAETELAGSLSYDLGTLTLHPDGGGTPEVLSTSLAAYLMRPKPGCAFIKDWGEHAGLAATLQEAGAVEVIAEHGVGSPRCRAFEVRVLGLRARLDSPAGQRND